MYPDPSDESNQPNKFRRLLVEDDDDNEYLSANNLCTQYERLNSNNNYNNTMNEERALFEREVEQFQTPTDLIIRDQIADDLRNAMNNTNNENNITREPPPILIDPTAMVQEGRQQRYRAIVYTTLAPMQTHTINSNIIQPPPSVDQYRQQRNINDVINTRRQPASFIFPRIEAESNRVGLDFAAEMNITNDSIIEERRRHDINYINSLRAGYDGENGEDESIDESTDESSSDESIGDESPVVINNDGWVDFTTADGFYEALRVVQHGIDGNQRTLPRDNKRTHTTMTENTTGMHIDPENGDEYQRINGVWRNITRETGNSPEPPEVVRNPPPILPTGAMSDVARQCAEFVNNNHRLRPTPKSRVVAPVARMTLSDQISDEIVEIAGRILERNNANGNNANGNNSGRNQQETNNIHPINENNTILENNVELEMIAESNVELENNITSENISIPIVENGGLPPAPNQIIYCPITQQPYYFNGTGYTPLTIDRAPNVVETANYMRTTMRDNMLLVGRTTLTNTQNNDPQVVPPIRFGANNQRRELNQNTNTTTVLLPHTNEMDHQQTNEIPAVKSNSTRPGEFTDRYRYIQQGDPDSPVNGLPMIGAPLTQGDCVIGKIQHVPATGANTTQQTIRTPAIPQQTTTPIIPTIPTITNQPNVANTRPSPTVPVVPTLTIPTQNVRTVPMIPSIPNQSTRTPVVPAQTTQAAVPLIIGREQPNVPIIVGGTGGIPQIPVVTNRFNPNVAPVPNVQINRNRTPFLPTQTIPSPVTRTNLPAPVPTIPQAQIPHVPRRNRVGTELPQFNFPALNIIPPGGLRMVVSPPKQAEIQLPTKNPYTELPRPVLEAIATERDILLTGTNDQRATQLYEFDHIMPDWIQSVMVNGIDTFQILTGSKLYVFGTLNGVSFENVPGLQGKDLVNYIRISILLANPDHPGRPVLTALIDGLNRGLLEIFVTRMNIPRNNIRFISTPELRTALRNGNANHIPNDAITRIATRYQTLTTHKHSRLFANLYNLEGNNDEDGWMTVARRDPHPMEQVIIDLDKFTDSDLVRNFGMAVPLSHDGNFRRYIENNIVSYSKILIRGNMDPIPLEVMIFMQPRDLHDYVSKLTDNEIFNGTQIYVSYNSRDELVANTISAIARPRFLYPVLRYATRAHNQVTIMGTEITDVNTFMVGFGTALKYYIYELGELTAAFYRADETGAMEFRRPENPRMKFTTADIEGLMVLLRCFSPTNEITTLLERINEGLIDAREKITHDDTARAQLNAFGKPTKDLIKQYLYQVFYTGMYMRRWLGPGHPFPLKEDQTKAIKDPEDKVTHELRIIGDILEQMSADARNFCMTLKQCQYNKDGSIEHGTAIFNTELDNVVKGFQCIRMASTRFIGTGLHYLRSLFRETVPGMNLAHLDRIV